MADNDSKTVRIPLFDGKSKGFMLWWIWFKAYAKERKFSQALGSTAEKDLPVMQKDAEGLDSSDSANKAAIEAIAPNEKALSNLAVAFTTSKAMVHYHKATTEDWPDGLACNVVKSLLKKYRPQDIISGIKYENALRSFKLKKGQDPTELFDHITEVNTQYGIEAPDEKKLIALALEKLPEHYVNTFTTLSMGGNINLDMFGEMVKAIYQANRSKAKSNDDEEDEEEVNLATFDDSQEKNKKGKWKKKGFAEGDDEDDELKCKHCGREGHPEDKCWMLDKNKGKRPGWFDPEKYCQKREQEVSNAAVSRSKGGFELLMMAMSFPKALELLNDPNVWIANTVASCDSTPHSRGAENVQKGNAGVIFGDGKNNEADEIFDLPGVIMDKNGNEILSARLQNVKHVKSAKFNLFSLTKCQKDRWLLNGDSEAISITKGGHKIVFDIRIKTPEGLIFTLYHKRNGDEVNATGPEQIVTKSSHKKCPASCKAIQQESNHRILRVHATKTEKNSKQQNMNNTKEEEVKQDDDKTRIYLNISSIKKPKNTKNIYKTGANYVEVNIQLGQGINKAIEADEEEDPSQESSNSSSESSGIEEIGDIEENDTSKSSNIEEIEIAENESVNEDEDNESVKEDEDTPEDIQSSESSGKNARVHDNEDKAKQEHLVECVQDSVAISKTRMSHML
jgi:hypothetical protein